MKFIFTICDIDHSLTDEFGFEREENGEVRSGNWQGQKSLK
jgi:hypothetical protein